MDWVHCNVCYSQPTLSSIGLQYYVTSCGHIFCDICGCYWDDTLKECKICHQKCSSTIKLNDETMPEVLAYFDEPENILKYLLEIIKFQKGHQAQLSRYHRQILQKLNRVTQYIKKLENELKQINYAIYANLQMTPDHSNQAPTTKLGKSPSMGLTRTVSEKKVQKIINNDFNKTY